VKTMQSGRSSRRHRIRKKTRAGGRSASVGRKRTETNAQRQARLAIAKYVQNLVDEEFFAEDELPDYKWVVKTLKKAGV